MRGALKFALTLALGLTATGCGDGVGPVGQAVGGGNTTVTVVVSSGTTPSYAWTGGNARKFSVTTVSGGSVIWDLEALNISQGFPAPVTHGVVPNTARELTASAPLLTGVDYMVHVTLIDGSNGVRTFKP
jgi:hypothetical protein